MADITELKLQIEEKKKAAPKSSLKRVVGGALISAFGLAGGVTAWDLITKTFSTWPAEYQFGSIILAFAVIAGIFIFCAFGRKWFGIDPSDTFKEFLEIIELLIELREEEAKAAPKAPIGPPAADIITPYPTEYGVFYKVVSDDPLKHTPPGAYKGRSPDGGHEAFFIDAPAWRAAGGHEESIERLPPGYHYYVVYTASGLETNGFYIRRLNTIYRGPCKQ